MAVSYNKMSSIQVAGSYANYVPSGTFLGNVSLDISGGTFLRNDTLINGKLFVVGDASFNSKLSAVGDASFNSKLSIGGDASFNGNLYVNGNTNLKTTTFNDVFPSPTKSITIGSNITPFTLTQTTGISPLTTVPPWIPTTINVPANNPYTQIGFTIPFDLAVVMTSTTPFLTGTITVTYNSITFAVKKNGVARTITTEYYTEVGFTAGGARTWVQGSGITTNYRFSSHWGYFEFGIPIDTFNATPDTYTIEITMNATATHGSGGTFTVQAIGVGQQITSSTSATSLFTQTYVFSPTTMTITPPTYPTYVAPFINQTSTSGMTISAPNGLYVSNGGDATYFANNSLLFKSGTGFWTAQSSSNYYYQSPTDTYAVIHGDQEGNEFLSLEFSTGTCSFRGTSALTFSDWSSITLNANTTVGVDKTFNMMPTATIIQNVSATVPSGFLYCNGQAVSRTVTYSRLFAAIGTTFGVGNGSTTFNVPNFQGAFLRGAGNQTVSSTVHTAAAVGTAQADDVLKHIHTYSDLYWYDDTTVPAGTTRSLTGANYEVPGGDTTGVNADGGQTKVMTSSRVFAEGATQANAATDPNNEIGAETRPMNYSVYYYIRY